MRNRSSPPSGALASTVTEAACNAEPTRPITPDAPSAGQEDASKVCQECGRRKIDVKLFTFTSRSHAGHPIYGSDHTDWEYRLYCPECAAAATRFSITEFLSNHVWIVVFVLAMGVVAVIDWLIGPVKTQPKPDFKPGQIELMDRMERDRQREEQFEKQEKERMKGQGQKDPW
jgi:hypothetical protein